MFSLYKQSELRLVPASNLTVTVPDVVTWHICIKLASRRLGLAPSRGQLARDQLASAAAMTPPGRQGELLAQLRELLTLPSSPPANKLESAVRPLAGAAGPGPSPPPQAAAPSTAMASGGRRRRRGSSKRGRDDHDEMASGEHHGEDPAAAAATRPRRHYYKRRYARTG